MMLLSVSAVVLGLATVSLCILSRIQTLQNDPYMDEIFHIPQAQQFCAKNFTKWDPMITTLPGLYFSSLLLLLPRAAISGEDLSMVCSNYNLRAGNILYCCGNLILVFLLSKTIYLATQRKRGATCHFLLNALTLSVFPVLYFFTWLYYTDPGSVFYTLLMYLLCLQGRHGLAAVSGALSILFRQTNVIWVLFCLASTTGKVIDARISRKTKVHPDTLRDFEYIKLMLSVIFSPISNFFYIVKDIVLKGISYISVLSCFCLFVYANKGIVVGDRKNHQASFNFPQVFYFLAVSAAFSFIHIIHPRQIMVSVKSLVRKPLKSILFTVVAYYLIQRFTYEHKYTLSDNRHYTFYVWSKIFKRFDWARYAAIPAYLFSLVSFYHLISHKSFVWRWSFCVCVILCLVPQSLLEFRYYIIPYFLLRLNMPLPSVKALLVELVFYVAINAFTLYMFLQRPFYWPSSPHPQRFMW